VEGMVITNFNVLLQETPEELRKIMTNLVRMADDRPQSVTTKPICSFPIVHVTYVLRKLPLTVVSFHPYPDDQLLPLVQAKYSQPVKETGINICTHTQIPLYSYCQHITP
jgi:hypothetical protein